MTANVTYTVEQRIGLLLRNSRCLSTGSDINWAVQTDNQISKLPNAN